MRGLDAYLTREPDTREEHDPQRQEEEAREQRWATFIELTRQWARTHGLIIVLRELSDAYTLPDFEWEPDSYADHVLNFADTEGWDGVMSAIARAMKDQAAEAAEIERRR